MMPKLVIKEIKSPGILEQERIVANAIEDVDIGDYVLFSALADDTGVYGGRGSAFWLKDVLAKKDDTVVIYSKKGVYKTKDLPDGRTSHFVYLNCVDSLWREPNRAAVLFNVGIDWTMCKPGGFADSQDTEPS